MQLDLNDEQTDALARLVMKTIDDDKYPLSPRKIMMLKGIPRQDPTGADARAAAAA